MVSAKFRKGTVIGGMVCLSLSNGLLFGQMTGMLRAMRKREDEISLSDREISIIASTVTTIATIGFGLAAAVTDKLGRKRSFILLTIPLILNWIILYYAKEMFMFMLSRILGGIGFGSLYGLCIFTTSEYTSPKTRAFFLHMVITVGSAIGTALGHALGIILHWRMVALIGIVPTSVGILLPHFWVESPHWLASKGRFEDCEQAFWKLHEKTSNTKAELQWLIEVEKNKLEKADVTNSRTTLKRLFLAFRKKYFWNLILLNMFIFTYIVASGKLVFSVFATVILEDITGTPDILLYTLLVDALFLLGSCMSLLLVRKMTMRNVIFVTGFIGNCLLIVLCLCLYFNNGQVYFRWVNVILIGSYFIIINSGPYPALEAIMGEIYPLELKAYCFFLTGIILCFYLASTLYLFPFMVNYLDYHGLFLLNTVLMTLSLVFMWFRLPETKGRTLQEIEVYFKTKIFDIDEALNNDQLKSFI